MERLLAILKRIRPDVDFETEQNLMDSGILDSVDLVNMIADIEEEFGISVDMEYIQPKYFQSVQTMWSMIEELL